MSDNLRRVAQILELIRPSRFSNLRVIRAGSLHDGGYVIVDDLSQNDFLISMGVGDNVEFEEYLAPRIKGMHLYDDSIDSLPKDLENSTLFNERVDLEPNVTISESISRASCYSDLLLKIDIEGSEWSALDTTSETLSSFRQIVVEFHWFSRILESEFYNQALKILSLLSRTHIILNSHPNNFGDISIIENQFLPDVIEITYLRKTSYIEDLAISEPPTIDLRTLNRPCDASTPELTLCNELKFNSELGATRSVGIINYRLRDALVQERDALVQERDALVQERDALVQERDALVQERDALVQERDALVSSRIWRLTSPLRRLARFVKS